MEYSVSILALFDQPSDFLFDTARRVAVSMLAGGGLLLIFFMLTSAIAIQDRLEVDLPQAETGRENAGPVITVLVNRDGMLAVNNVVVDQDDFAGSLRDARAVGSGNVLMIKADAGTRTAEVVRILKIAREAGMENVKIATQLASSK